ncbi:MAG: PQQ-dependent sugar dehydrogenase [Planctomycetaceae bacterium]|nr:PQQ-dependent sugar dehydrogenase [Planctomycetaceae bacterium]
MLKTPGNNAGEDSGQSEITSMNQSGRLRILLCVLTGCWATNSVTPWQCSRAASAADEPREAWTSSHLQGTPYAPEPFQISAAFPGVRFDHPTSLLELPGTSRFLVAEIGGKILTFENSADVQSADPAADLAALAGDGVSLFAAVADPEFARNHFLYVCLVHPDGGRHTRVSRWTMSADSPPTIDPASEVVIIKWPSGGHNAGCLRFGPDGLLYIATGDGSGPNPPDGLTTGQDVSDLLGAILRIDVRNTGAKQPYSIPDDNPFVRLPEARPEVFAYGLRNPWKFGIDRNNGELYVADNGWETWEMIHLVRGGSNCGWPVMEGRVPLRTEVPVGPTPIVPPIRDHHHSEANSVIGGPVYHGAELPELDGQFIYGDYITGTIWSVGRSTDGSFVGQTLVDTDLRITDFLETSDGKLLVVDYDLTGQIYRLKKNTSEDRSATFPRHLSETGLFESLTPLKPAPGVSSYDVTVSRWMDGAAAKRFVAVPDTGVIATSPHSGQSGAYPEGTAFAKHLTVPSADGKPERPLETQVLLLQDGVWSPYVYLWNESGTDAELVPPTGAQTAVNWPVGTTDSQERTWHSGTTNECRLCHNAAAGYVLGFVGNQLSGKPSPNGGSQLDGLIRQNVVRSDAAEDLESSSALVDPFDSSASLTDRARSYLHGNCSMCHHKGGNAIVSFYLSRDLTFEQMNTNKGTGIGTFGMQNARIIVPGDPYRSVLMYRFSKLGNGRMPYIGSYSVDSHGVDLLDAWIRSLPATQPLSDPLTPGTSVARALDEIATEGLSQERRQQDITDLLKTTEGALALTARLHAGTLNDAIQQTAAMSAATSGNDIRGLFDHFVPESKRKKTLGRQFDPELVLSQPADVDRGRLIFLSDHARCRTCHHASDPEQSVGPTLLEVSKKYTVKSELLQHVMQPSLRIDERFAAWAVLTADGRIITGLLQSQTDDAVVIRTAERKLVTIPTEQIDEIRRSMTSLMPDGVLSDLTPTEAADLLQYIQSLNPTSAPSL